MTGAPNETYGVGVKSGCWPWNPYGFVVVSRKDGETNMLWVQKTGGEYELRQFPVEEFDGDEAGVLASCSVRTWSRCIFLGQIEELGSRLGPAQPLTCRLLHTRSHTQPAERLPPTCLVGSCFARPHE